MEAQIFEEAGHRWPEAAPCERCGLKYFDFSRALQAGELLHCTGAGAEPLHRVIDGIIITGPIA